MSLVAVKLSRSVNWDTAIREPYQLLELFKQFLREKKREKEINFITEYSAKICHLWKIIC